MNELQSSKEAVRRAEQNALALKAWLEDHERYISDLNRRLEPLSRSPFTTIFGF